MTFQALIKKKTNHQHLYVRRHRETQRSFSQIFIINILNNSILIKTTVPHTCCHMNDHSCGGISSEFVHFFLIFSSHLLSPSFHISEHHIPVHRPSIRFLDTCTHLQLVTHMVSCAFRLISHSVYGHFMVSLSSFSLCLTILSHSFTQRCQ